MGLGQKGFQSDVGCVSGPLVKGSKVEFEFLDNICEFALRVCDGSSGFLMLSTQFHRSPGVVVLGFAIGRGPHLLDASFCVVGYYEKEPLLDVVEHFPLNTRQIIQVVGWGRNSARDP